MQVKQLYRLFGDDAANVVDRITATISGMEEAPPAVPNAPPPVPGSDTLEFTSSVAAIIRTVTVHPERYPDPVVPAW